MVNNSTVTSCQQFPSQSDAADAVCMETSFGVESDEPRTHIFHNTDEQFNTQLLSLGFLLMHFCLFWSTSERESIRMLTIRLIYCPHLF